MGKSSGNRGNSAPASGERKSLSAHEAYCSTEIVAEIYAQALEGAGKEVERKFNIGQRDAYMPQLEDGAIDVFPEYTGNLLQFFKDDTKARASDEVYKELEAELPDSLAVLEQAKASDQDSYTVTRKFADENELKSMNQQGLWSVRKRAL